MHEIIRELAPSNVRRQLECLGGPWCGERHTLEADESVIVCASGHYVAVVITRGDRSCERLRWRQD